MSGAFRRRLSAGLRFPASRATKRKPPCEAAEPISGCENTSELRCGRRTGVLTGSAILPGADLGSLEPLRRFERLELHFLPFLQRAVAFHTDRRVMDEYILVAFLLDETVSLCFVELLHLSRALHHVASVKGVRMKYHGMSNYVNNHLIIKDLFQITVLYTSKSCPCLPAWTGRARRRRAREAHRRSSRAWGNRRSPAKP